MDNLIRNNPGMRDAFVYEYACIHSICALMPTYTHTQVHAYTHTHAYMLSGPGPPSRPPAPPGWCGLGLPASVPPMLPHPCPV